MPNIKPQFKNIQIKSERIVLPNRGKVNNELCLILEKYYEKFVKKKLKLL